MNDDEDMLPIGVNSLSDYTPYKLNLLLNTPIPIDDVSVSQQVPTKSKTSSRKRSFIRYFIPNSRSRSSSIQYEQDPPLQDQQTNEICDMRFLIIRHGERVDRFFGANWYKLAFDENEQYRPYHRNFPSSLPYRSNKYFWALDTPLTSMGLALAEKLGRTLDKKKLRPNYVYSSPAIRCILTTIQILKGLKLENQIAIRIEPGLLEFGASRFGMHIFFQPIEWQRYGINIDLSYQPIITNVPPVEREEAYYLRSKHVIREIENRHKNSSNQLLNIFIIAHATSPETLTWDLIGKQPNVNDLYKLSLNIAYLQMVSIEHKQDKQFWSLEPIR